MAVLYANNARSTLAASITASQTTLTVAAGHGALFPAPTGSDVFYATLTDINESIREIVRVTARATDTLTVVRGQDGTSAQSWAADTKVELRLTKAMLDDFKTDARSGLLSGNQTVTLSGDVSGSGTTSIATTLANSGVSAGTYPKVTVDAKGRVTSGSSLASGDLPTYGGTLSSSQVTTALGYTPYNNTNPSGYISGINAANVTAALGFTPYNSTNPSGYVTSSGSGASGTWGINITGSAASAGSVSGLTLNNSANGINPDSVTQNQIGYNTSVSLYGQADGGLYSSAYSGSWIHQIFGDFRSGQIAVRGKNNGTWQAWRAVLDASNYTSYSPSLTGSGASGTWGINVTGSANTVTNLNGAITILSGGGGATFSSNHYSIGKDIANGSWSHPHYSDLIIGYHTGIRIGAGYSGIRFYNNSPTTDANNDGNGDGGESLLMTIGGHAGGSDVIINNNLQLSSGNLKLGQGDGTALRVTTAHGWLNLGAQNSSWAHMYSNLNFYFNNGIWIAGNRVLDAGNYSSYAPSLTGSGASGTWGINVTGSAGTLQGYQWNSSGKDIRGSDIYADSWLRNYNSGTGLYNQATANHWYSDGQYWNIGYSGTTGIRLRNGHNGTILGYLYGETNGNFGLLHNGGGWAVQVNPGGGGNLHGTWTVGGSTPLTAGNYSSYALPLSGGTVSGRTTFADGLRIGPTPGDPNAYIITRTIPAGDPNVGNEATELLLFHANDNANGAGPDYITLRAPAIRLQTYDDAGVGDPDASGGWNNRLTISPSGVVNVPNTLQQGGNQVLHTGNYTSYAAAASHTQSVTTLSDRPSWFGGGSFIASHSNANDWRNSGFYENDGGGSNWPSLTWYNSINVRHSNQGNYHGFQVAMSYYDNNLWFRSYQGYGTFQSWAVALSSQNYTSYSPSLTGSGASGTWGINITGESRSVNLGGSGSTITNSSWAGGDGYHGYTFNGGNFRFGFSSTGGVVDVYADGNFYATDSSHLVLHAGNYSSYALPLSGGTVSGIAYFLTNNGGYCGSTDNAKLQAYSTGNNSAFLSFHKGGYYAVNMGLDADNVIRIGGWSASANRWQLDMSGNGTYAGNVTAYSDERLKKDWAPIDSGFVQQLASLRAGTYTRTDSGERQAGVSAQDMREILPEVVTEDHDGMLALAYGNAALVSAVELAKDNAALRARIERLEAIVATLLGDRQ